MPSVRLFLVSGRPGGALKWRLVRINVLMVFVHPLAPFSVAVCVGLSLSFFNFHSFRASVGLFFGFRSSSATCPGTQIWPKKRRSFFGQISSEMLDRQMP